MEQGGLTKHLNAKHRLVSSQSSEAALTKVPPAPTKAQMGSVLDDIDIDVPDDTLLDALLSSDDELLLSSDGEVRVDYDGTMQLTLGV